MTSGLATCLIATCLGLLFYRENHSTSGIVMRFTDLIYLQKKKKYCFYYITVPVIVQLLDACPFSSHAIFSGKPYLAFLFWAPEVLNLLQIAIFKNSMITHKNVNFWFLS